MTCMYSQFDGLIYSSLNFRDIPLIISIGLSVILSYFFLL